MVGQNGIILNCNGYAITATSGNSGRGIELIGRNRVTVQDCQVTGFNVGFYALSSSNNTFTEDTANIGVPLVANGTGFGLYNSSRNTLAGDIVGNTMMGVFEDLTSSRNTFAGDSVTDGGYGFYSWGFNNTLTRNTASSNTQYGFYDTSEGGGTNGTANFYTFDACYGNGVGGSSPEGLCPPTFSSGESASLVIGQSSFVSAESGTSASLLSRPRGVAFDGSGDMWVPDAGNNRILEFVPPFTDGMLDSLVLGQNSNTTGEPGTAANSLRGPREVAFDNSGDLWVADTLNNRILEFEPNFTSGMSATRVVGQSSFTSNTCVSVCFLLGIAFDSKGDLWVTNSNDNTVLEYTSTQLQGGDFITAPSLTIGGTFDWTCPSSNPWCDEFDGPVDIAFSWNRTMYVADFGNSRILGFDYPYTSGESPSVVVGQPNFTANSCVTSQTRICAPTGLTFDSKGNMWVADSGSDRLLEFAGPTFTTGMSASVVIGQSNFTSWAPRTTQNGLLLELNRTAAIESPESPAFAVYVTKPAFAPDGTLWISDTGNNRILDFGSSVAASTTTTLSNGGATVNQTSTTGTVVTITGSSAETGTNVTVTSQISGTTQPPETGTITLNSNSTIYFDVQVQGITDGTAEVCITNAAVTSSTVMQYWSGTEWISPADQVVTGTTVCGYIPVSALGGSPIVIGHFVSGGSGSAVTVASPYISLSLSSNEITAGGAVHGTATLSGLASTASGTVYYYYYSGDSCSVGRTLVSSFTLSNGEVPSSSSQTFESGGIYSWDAVYGGDPNDNGAISPCTQLTQLAVTGPSSVSCTPSTLDVGTPTTCTATVTGDSTPTGKVTWSSTGAGVFSPKTCVLSKGACSVKFTPTSGISSGIIDASYQGDKHNQASSGTFGLAVSQKGSVTKVSCAPSTVILSTAKSIECTAKVTGYKPTGEVTWSEVSGTGLVLFASSVDTCTLAKGHCSVTIAGADAGSAIVQASYGGDENNVASRGTEAKLTIKQAKTSLSLDCAVKSENVWSCKATLKGYYLVAGETISWSQSSGKGGVSFPSLPTCIISLTGTCSVTVTGTSAGNVKIEAVYSGDQNNAGSSKTTSLKVA